jgi:hypothetical protein
MAQEIHHAVSCIFLVILELLSGFVRLERMVGKFQPVIRQLFDRN